MNSILKKVAYNYACRLSEGKAGAVGVERGGY